jgi:hypothetical protein
MSPGSKKRKTTKGKATAARVKSPRCKHCGKLIRVPAGWTSHLPAVRKHYWRYHRDVMQPGVGKGRS